MKKYTEILLSPGGDSVKGAVLEPLSRIIGTKYAGAETVPAYFKGDVAFCNVPFYVFLAEQRLNHIDETHVPYYVE